MLKKEITFKDYNGVEKTKSYYFNINRSEMVNMEIRTPQGYEEKVKALLKENDRVKIYDFFMNFIKMTYGVKSEDGSSFIKNDKVFEEFTYSPAYDQLIVDFLKDPDSITAFIEGVMPDMSKEEEAEYKKHREKMLSELHTIEGTAKDVQD